MATMWSRAVWQENAGREEEMVIPSTWVQGEHVRWPNSREKIAYQNQEVPSKQWLTFPLVKVKCTSGNKQTCDDYDMTTDISGGEEKTLDDEHGELSESSEASSEELEEGDDANSKNDYPKPPEKFQKKGLTKRPVSSQVISNDGEYEMHRPKPTKKKKTAHTQSTTRQSKTSTPPEDDNTRNSGFPISEARFQQRVLHMLSEIKNTLAQVGKRCEPEDSDFHITKANSLDEIQELESSLEDEKLQNLLFSRLCKVGGITATENVRNVMHRLMENKVMANMNFKGKGGKYAFGETKMFQMVKRSVLRNQPNTTETEITKIVMALLKYAPDRAGGGGRKQN